MVQRSWIRRKFTKKFRKRTFEERESLKMKYYNIDVSYAIFT